MTCVVLFLYWPILTECFAVHSKKKMLFDGILLFYFTVFSRIFEIQLKIVKLQKLL